MVLTFLFIIYFSITGILLESVLLGVFRFSQTKRTTILAMFLNLSFFNFIIGAFVAFYKVNLLTIAISVFLDIILIWALRRLVKQNDTVIINDEPIEGELTAPTATWWGVILYLVLAGYGFYLLYSSKSVASIITPWQTIDHAYIYIFAFATLLVGALIFSKLPTTVIFFLLLVHGAILHSYLPLTHQLFYGADQWRHTAVEGRILAERPLEPAKLSAPATTIENQLTITSSGLSITTLAYSSFWGLPVVIARLTGIDLLTLNKWLVPILWSLILPILLFELGETLRLRNRASLFLVWLSFLPFTLQAAGALTLPFSFGFLAWLLSVLLLLKRIQQPERTQLPVLLIFGILSVFSYTLYFILFWLGWGIAEILIRIRNQHPILKILVAAVVAAVSGLVLPAVELLSHYSQLPQQINWLRQLKQLVGNLTGWYLATGPQVSDITTGNIIFNQTPLSSNVSNYFTIWPWWLAVFMFIWGVLAIIGVVIALRKTADQQWLGVLGTALFISYVSSRYFLIGENIFTRRLDPVLALFWIVFVVMTLSATRFFSMRKILLAPSLIILSCAIVASYSLGPDTGTVNASEYKAMQFIWNNRDKNAREHCIIADTYPLLALEALSSKDIIGGGFPINQYFSQPELASLYQTFSGSEADWEKALGLTGAKGCAFVGELANGIPENRRFGNVGVWWYPR